MSVNRLPVILLAAGVLLKAFAVVLWRVSKIPVLLNLAMRYDPGAFYFAQEGVTLLFDQRRIAPTSQEIAMFEVLLICGFGIECLAVGYCIKWVVEWLRRVAPREGRSA
jgi:hypothetical protein